MPHDHTPLPWEVEQTENGEWGLFAEGSDLSLSEFEREGDARFDALACNHHGPALDGLRWAVRTIERSGVKLTAADEEQLENLRHLVAKMGEVW